MILAEQTKIVAGLMPVDANGGKTGDYVSLKNYNHCTVIVKAGVVGATCNLTINKATAVAPTGATTATVSYVWLNSDTTSTDALVKTAVTSNTVATGTDNSQMWVFEIDAASLGETSGTPYDCIAAVISDPSDTNYMDVTYILSEPRYAGATPPTAIAD